MPRSAVKSQADKLRRRSSVQANTPLPQDLEVEDKDVIPGRFTQAQWMDILIQEDADETVGEIMGELLSNVMEGCFKVFIERQLVPFSASWAKSYLTQTLEQQVMCLDEGDGPDEIFKTEDLEPVPTILDPWAPGCVPVVNTTPRPHPASQQEVDNGHVPVRMTVRANKKCNVVCQTNTSRKQPKKETRPWGSVRDKNTKMEVDHSQVPAQTEPSVDNQCNVMAQTNISPKQSEKETSPRRPVRDKHNKVLSPRVSLDRNNKLQINSPPKHIPGKLLPPLSCSTEKRDLKVEDRTRGVSSPRTVSLKDCQPIPRLDPSSLPRHYIFPQYEILDDNKSISRKPNGLFKLEPRFSKQQNEGTVTSVKPLTCSKDDPANFQRKKEADASMKTLSPFSHKIQEMVTSGPLRLETMELAKGVSLLDPQAIDINSFRLTPPTQSTKLRPIQSDAAVPQFSVEQLTSGPPPRVIQLDQSKNWDN